MRLDPALLTRYQTGTVIWFDQARGLGEIQAGEIRVPFHCIEIADGSRAIESGTNVRFQIRPKLGRHEAAGIIPV
jgi:cold shock CspA family protein